MMEFLDKIYGSENFGIILFAVIMGLVVLFMIILFFGKKDEKKRELERTQKLEREAMNGFAETNNGVAPLEVAAPAPTVVEETTNVEVENAIVNEIPVMEPLPTVDLEQPVLEPVSEPVLTMPVEQPSVANVEEANNVVVEPVVPTEINLEPIVSEEVVNNIPVPEEPKKEIEIPNFNFEELAASIAQELSALEKQSQVVKEAVVEPEVKVEPVVEINNNVSEQTLNDLVKPVVETPKVTRPVTFSSVYINKPAEPVVPVEPVAPVMPQELVRMPEVTVTPVVEQPVPEVVVAPAPKPINPMPNIDLPKPAEMPMLKQEVKTEPVNNPTTIVPDFSQFEGESYDIK